MRHVVAHGTVLSIGTAKTVTCSSLDRRRPSRASHSVRLPSRQRRCSAQLDPVVRPATSRSPQGRWLELPRPRARPGVTELPGPARLPHRSCCCTRSAAPACSPGSRRSSRARERYRVVVFDQRWHGRGIISRSFSLHDCADDVAARDHRARARATPIVAGYSMGSIIAQRVWRQHPDARRRPGARAPRPTTSGTDRSERVFHAGMEISDGRAADALEVADRAPRHAASTAEALDLGPTDIARVGARRVAQHQPVGGRPGRRRARPAPLDARGSSRIDVPDRGRGHPARTR